MSLFQYFILKFVQAKYPSMAFENFPTTEQPASSSPTPQKKYIREILTGVLLVALLGTWGYIIWDKNKNNEATKETNSQLAIVSAERDNLQKMVDEATMRYDMIKSSSGDFLEKGDSNIIKKNTEIEQKKVIINNLLAKVNATKEDLNEAKRLIASLNDDIMHYKSQIEALQGEKLVLKKENTNLTNEKIAITLQKDKWKKGYDSTRSALKEKENLIDIASTLQASNFNIIGINETKGGKEKETNTAKRVDKLRISFQIDENRVAKSGVKEIYISITAPNGAAIMVSELGSGKFIARDGREQFYTNKVNINYIQGQVQTISFDWKPEVSFNTGDYKIEVFHNGFKIGEGYRKLKKGGLFG